MPQPGLKCQIRSTSFVRNPSFFARLGTLLEIGAVVGETLAQAVGYGSNPAPTQLAANMGTGGFGQRHRPGDEEPRSDYDVGVDAGYGIMPSTITPVCCFDNGDFRFRNETGSQAPMAREGSVSSNTGIIDMDTVKFSAGEKILTEGEDGNAAFLIVGGSVEVSVGEGARAKIVGTLKDGEVFGEMSLIEPGPRSATVKALADTECVAMTYDEFIASIQDNPERAAAFMKTLVGRLRQMNERMANLDPGRRGFREILRDLQKSAEPDEAEQQRIAMMYWPMV